MVLRRSSKVQRLLFFRGSLPDLQLGDQFTRSTERLGFDVCGSEGGSCGRDDGVVVGVSVGLDHDYLQQTPGKCISYVDDKICSCGR